MHIRKGEKAVRILCKELTLMFIGGGVYYLLEGFYKLVLHPGGTTHWSMAVLGGLMFLIIGGLNEYLPWHMPLALQATIGMALVTVAELLAGIVLNLCLQLDIWDYSAYRFQFLGQISLHFILLWWLLSLVAIVLDDWLRHWIWKEERPHYH